MEEWFKFYSEFIDDPKMKRCTIEEWGVWLGLLCLAAKSPTFGSLYISKDLKYELSDICLALNNYDIEKLKIVLNKFQELKMIDYDENNAINITHFRERQSSDHPRITYERVKKFREKRQRNGNETDLKRDDNALDIDIDKDKDNILFGIRDFWNSYQSASSLPSIGQIRNTSARARLLPQCRRITPDIKKAFAALKGYTEEDFKKAIQNYIKEILARNPATDYASHRFSFYEFFKQSNGFKKFVNR